MIKDPVVIFNSFGRMESVCDVLRLELMIYYDPGVEWQAVLVALICDVIDDNIAEQLCKLPLLRRHPKNAAKLASLGIYINKDDPAVILLLEFDQTFDSSHHIPPQVHH